MIGWFLVACRFGTPVPGPANIDAIPCAADADCAVTCSVPGSCCDDLCAPCTRLVHARTLADHNAWHQRACADAQCPVADCDRPAFDPVARCVAGTCTIERIPLPTP